VGAPALGLAVLLPVLVLAFAVTRVSILRSALLEIPVALLIGVNVVRILGVFFVLLRAAGRLPAPFAPIAGGATSWSVRWRYRSPGLLPGRFKVGDRQPSRGTS
jgi:hypothetical protein